MLSRILNKKKPVHLSKCSWWWTVFFSFISLPESYVKLKYKINLLLKESWVRCFILQVNGFLRNLEVPHSQFVYIFRFVRFVYGVYLRCSIFYAIFFGEHFYIFCRPSEFFVIKLVDCELMCHSNAREWSTWMFARSKWKSVDNIEGLMRF